jgi:hypothetical protein
MLIKINYLPLNWCSDNGGRNARNQFLIKVAIRKKETVSKLIIC